MNTRDLERNDDELTVGTQDEEDGIVIDRKETWGPCLHRCFPNAPHYWVVLGVVLLGCAILLVLEVVLPLFSSGSNSGSSSSNNSVQFQKANTGQPLAPTARERISVSQEGSYTVDVGDGNKTSPLDPVPESAEPVSQCIVDADGFVVSGFEEAPIYPEIDSVNPSWTDGAIGVGTWDSFIRSFDVKPNHTVLEDGKGVIFNVETVPEALPEDANQTRLSEEEIWNHVKTEAGRFYREGGYPEPPIPDVNLEVLSKIAEGNLVFVGGQGFVAACMMAFAYHLPLALTPDDLWTVIISGFGYHVNEHSEELRANFVNFTDKVTIEIREDTMRMGESSPEQWQELIFPKFTEKIAQHMNNSQVYDLLVNSTFSTSTTASHAASEIVLMAAMKSYFDYTMVTSCGIPRIQLDGTREDWQSLRDRTEQLGHWMMHNHTQGDLWIENVVLPILDQFLEAYDGNMNYCFWQNMVKFRNTNDRSGAFDFLSGWLPTLFPYLDQGNGVILPNRYLRHWSQSALGDMRGPDPNQIPIQMSSVPVLWEYFEQEFPLHFHAGFRGVHQEEDNEGMLRPALGWYVSYDP